MTRKPALPPEGRKRKHRPLRVERDACLYLLEIDPSQPIEWHHSPPLGLRPWNEATQDYIPPENSFKHLRPMQVAVHKKVTKEVDRPAIDKTRRRAKKQAAHAKAMDVEDIDGDLAEIEGIVRSRSKWPKGRKLQSRSFWKKDDTKRRVKPTQRKKVG